MAKRRMAELRAGETLVVLATDPEAPIDIAAWADADGHTLTELRREDWTEFRLVKHAHPTSGRTATP
jgi:TusA-related sulfurtransferase